eukprot:TRINITY_DN4101_c0_g1_i2.p1 TRINITY_DN4101_c0_g1~~TRINITY_DN4101_c0_g1_i2.p1  ORF type:complete len:291 (+),score=54.33 TRINITY_DN4101_c0_g1_i2:43-915(+)
MRLLIATMAMLTLVGCEGSDPKTVRWIVNSKNTDENIQMWKNHEGVVKGFVGASGLTSGVINVSKNGSTAVVEGHNLKNEAAIPLAKGLEYHALLNVDQEAIQSGAAAKQCSEAIELADNANITGLLVDYEPTTNFTMKHTEAYAGYLRCLKTAGNKKNLQISMVVSDWGIIQSLDTYAELNLDSYTSTSPTRQAAQANSDIGTKFVENMIAAFGAKRTFVGIGTVDTPRASCSKNYGWSKDSLEKFLNTSSKAGVAHIDVFRCDIQKYSPIDPFFFNDLSAWVAQSDIN